MLRLQLQKLLNNNSLGLRLIGCSILLHACALFGLFFLYNQTSVYNVTVTSTMIDTDVPVVFVPLHKSLAHMSGNGTPTAQKKVNRTAQLPRGTTIVPAIGKAKERNSRTDSKKREKKKNLTSKPKIEKKEQAPKEMVKKVLPVVDEKPLPSRQLPSAPSPIVTDRPEEAVMSESPVLYVGQQEMEACRMQEFIQSALTQHWMPPPGMSSDMQCVITVSFGFNGQIRSLEIVESSGKPLFDAAARKSAALLEPPSWMWGKELQITFKP